MKHRYAAEIVLTKRSLDALDEYLDKCVAFAASFREMRFRKSRGYDLSASGFAWIASRQMKIIDGLISKCRAALSESQGAAAVFEPDACAATIFIPSYVRGFPIVFRIGVAPKDKRYGKTGKTEHAFERVVPRRVLSEGYEKAKTKWRRTARVFPPPKIWLFGKLNRRQQEILRCFWIKRAGKPVWFDDSLNRIERPTRWTFARVVPEYDRKK